MRNNSCGERPCVIVFVISSLGCGGAEKVVTNIANHLSVLGNSVSIVTFDSPVNKPFFPLNKEIELVQCDMLHVGTNFISGLKNNIKRILILRRIIKRLKGDIVISFMDRTNVITLIATRFLKIPVIVSDRTDPILGNPGRMWRLLRIIMYHFACKIAVQTEKVVNKYPVTFRKKIVVIPNPVMKPEKKLVQRQGNLIVGIGRLSEEKNFHLLIEAFYGIKKKYPDWHLEIYGDGPLRKQLENLILKLNLKDSVKLPGVVKDIDEVLQRADIFVLCSKFEGFPNVLCEAMANGCAVVSSRCGPAEEIIIDNENGLLVNINDVEEIKKAIEHLITNEGLRSRIGEKGREITEKYSMDRIIGNWLCVIEECAISKFKRIGCDEHEKN